MVPILQAFLECSLEYLSVNAMEKEFCFSSLEKLARTVQHKGQSSRFELLMGGSNTKSFERFCELYTINTQRDLIVAFQRIMDYLETFHGRVQIQFIIKKRKKTQGGK